MCCAVEVREREKGEEENIEQEEKSKKNTREKKKRNQLPTHSPPISSVGAWNEAKEGVAWLECSNGKGKKKKKCIHYL